MYLLNMLMILSILKNDADVAIKGSRDMSSELKVILLKGIEENFHEECNETIGRLEHIKSLLISNANTGSLRLPITVRGVEIRYPGCEKDLSLLERCGLVKSRIKYTEHSSHRVYELSEEGASLVRKLSTHQ